jgi:hypothetical protein
MKISIYMKEKNKHKNLDNSSAQSGIEEKGHFQQINYSNIQFTLQQKISNWILSEWRWSHHHLMYKIWGSAVKNDDNHDDKSPATQCCIAGSEISMVGETINQIPQDCDLCHHNSPVTQYQRIYFTLSSRLVTF